MSFEVRTRPAMTLLLAVTLVLRSAVACAESDPQTFAPTKLDLTTLDRSYRRAKARRNVGIGLAVPGVALNVIGVVLFCYGITINDDQHLLGQGEEIAWGGVIAGIGAVLAIPGIVFWIIDQDAMDVLTWRRRQITTVSVRPLATPGGAGLGLAVSF